MVREPRHRLPVAVLEREKFGIAVAGVPALIQRRSEAVLDRLSRSNTERAGVFDADAVEALVRQYEQPGFRIQPPFEDDLLAVVLTLNMLQEEFRLPRFAR